MLSILKSLALFLFLCQMPIFMQAQAEFRVGFLTSKPIKENYGVQLEYALPLGKFFELTPSVWAMQNTQIRTGFPDCTVGEPFLISKQRIAQRNYIDKSHNYLLSLGFNVKPLAKISQKHDLGLGALFAYGHFKYEYISKVETEDGSFAQVNTDTGKGGGGGVLVQLRYAYAFSNKIKLGIRYMNEVSFYNLIGIWSIYGAYKF